MNIWRTMEASPALKMTPAFGTLFPGRGTLSRGYKDGTDVEVNVEHPAGYLGTPLFTSRSGLCVLGLDVATRSHVVTPLGTKDTNVRLRFREQRLRDAVEERLWDAVLVLPLPYTGHCCHYSITF